MNDIESITIKPYPPISDLSNPINIYNNSTRMPDRENEVYSSTLCILRGLTETIREASKIYWDQALEDVILTIASDTVTDLLRFKQRMKDKGFRILTPAIALSLESYKTMFAPTNNIKRFERFYFNNTANLISYIAVPMEFHIKMRYYTTNADLLFRFIENMTFNGQLALPNKGFEYETLDENNNVRFVKGTIVVDALNFNYVPKRVTIQDKHAGELWSIEVPLFVWATVISKPYLTKAVTSTKVSINLKEGKVNEYIEITN